MHNRPDHPPTPSPPFTSNSKSSIASHTQNAFDVFATPGTFPGSWYLKSYVHELHCNASRLKPIGCEMCSCELGRAFKRNRRSP